MIVVEKPCHTSYLNGLRSLIEIGYPYFLFGTILNISTDFYNMGIVGKIKKSIFYKTANFNCTQLLYGRSRALIMTDKFRLNYAVKTASCRAPKTQFMHKISLQTFIKYKIDILYLFDIGHLLKWQHLCPLEQRLYHCSPLPCIPTWRLSVYF